MKKIYFLAIFAVLALTGARLNAQVNILKGSNMGAADAAAWDTSNLANNPTATLTYSFGYTADKPADGTDSCLYISEANTGTGGTFIMFYQKVILNKQHHYLFDMAIKTLSSMNGHTFFEIYLGDKIPATGQDYSAGTTFGAIRMGGIKSSEQEPNCAGNGNMVDGLYSVITCISGIDTINFDTASSAYLTKYLGFKTGIWATSMAIDYVVDDVTFTDLDSTAENAINTIDAITLNAFPNPASTVINIEGASLYTQASIMNVLGQEVVTVNNFSNSIDVSGLKPGMYFIKLTDSQNNIALSKFQKR